MALHYHLELLMNVDTEPHAQTILSEAMAALAGMDVLEEHESSVYVDAEDQVQVEVYVRFNIEAERETAKDWVIGKFTGPGNWQDWVAPGSRMRARDIDSSLVLHVQRGDNYREWFK
jgi:hypothetical protein